MSTLITRALPVRIVLAVALLIGFIGPRPNVAAAELPQHVHDSNTQRPASPPKLVVLDVELSGDLGGPELVAPAVDLAAEEDDPLA